MSDDPQGSAAPRVTVLLAAHNRLGLLQQAIESALLQDYRPMDVLVVDDGSDEPVRRWLEAAADSEDRLQVLHQSKLGVAPARQKGLMAAEGELVCILDSDDELLPGALRRIVNVFNANPETDLVYAYYLNRRRDGKESVVTLPRFENNRSMIRSTLIRPRVPFKHSGTTFRRTKALALGGYDTNLPIKVDIDLFLKFLTTGSRLRLIEEPTVRFLMHRDAISRRRAEGLVVWNQLIDRYGPENRLARVYMKTVRAAAERMKSIYEKVRL